MKNTIDTKEWKRAGVPELQAGFRFLCKPISRKKPGSLDNVIHHHVLNDGEHWWATDGHRLHRLDLKGFGDPGVYEVVNNTKGQIILQKTDTPLTYYPDVLNVWPDTDGWKEIGCSEPNLIKAYADITRAMEDDRALNYEYLKDVLCDYFAAFVGGSGRPIKFENCTKAAVIMPCMI